MLTVAAQNILQLMVAAYDRSDWEEAELACEGRECWLGHVTTTRAVVNELLRSALIRNTASTGDMQRYSINEDGRKAAGDPGHMNSSLRAATQALAKEQACAGLKTAKRKRTRATKSTRS